MRHSNVRASDYVEDGTAVIDAGISSDDVHRDSWKRSDATVRRSITVTWRHRDSGRKQPANVAFMTDATRFAMADGFAVFRSDHQLTRIPALLLLTEDSQWKMPMLSRRNHSIAHESATSASIQVAAPTAAIQRRIASILSAYDDLIENNTRRIKILEQMAQMLYREWFVNFRFPGHEKVKMVESPLGKIPQGSEPAIFSKVAEIARTGINPAQFPDEQFWHYSIPAFDAGRMPLLERGETILSNKFLLEADCVLLAKLNPRIPRVWLPFFDGQHRAVAFQRSFSRSFPAPGSHCPTFSAFAAQMSFLACAGRALRGY